MLRHLSKPVMTVLRWQLAATAALALAAGMLAGVHGALSAIAGGLVSITAGLAAAFVASRGDTKSAGGVLVGALRAEGIKIGLIAVLLWLVLKAYPEVVVIAFFASFMVTVLIFAMAFFVRDP
jgi:ATP synthase protein I